MDKTAVRKHFTSLAITFAPLIGALVGALLAYFVVVVQINLSYSGALIRWHNLGKPPSGVANIEHIADYPESVFVKSNDGLFFEAERERCELSPDNCWNQVTEIPQDSDYFYGMNLDYPCERIRTKFNKMNEPPKTTQTCAYASEIGPDGIYNEIHYVILNDGTVSHWQHGNVTKNAGLLACANGLFGFFMGLFIGGFFKAIKRGEKINWIPWGNDSG